jgi:hypothetical protein
MPLGRSARRRIPVLPVLTLAAVSSLVDADGFLFLTMAV